MSLDEWWYAVCTYDAPSEEQLSIINGEAIQLIDDSDNEWWYAKCPRTEQVGYIPALFIESTEDRIARINTIKNSQLTLPLQSDREAKSKPANGSIGSRRKTFGVRAVQFNPIASYDDGTTGPAERSTTQLLMRKIAKLTRKSSRRKVERPQRDVRTELGVLRIYADIWNLVTTYKSVKVTPDTTAADVLKMAVERFSPGDDGTATYALYLATDKSERKLSPFEYPMDELEALPEEQRAAARFFLKRNVVEKDAVPVRIYFGDEATFKTILVDKTTRVEEALAAAAQKFKLVDSVDSFYMREQRGDKSGPLEPTTLLYPLLDRNKDADGNSQQKLFLAKRTGEEDTTEAVDTRIILRIYSHALDMDVSYRTLPVTPTLRASEMVPLALKSFGSLDDPEDYSLVMIFPGKPDRVLPGDTVLVDAVNGVLAADGGAGVKLYLRKNPTATSPRPLQTGTLSRLLMTRMPLRIYCSFASKQSPDEFSNVLVSEHSTAASVLFAAIERLSLPVDGAYALVLTCDQQESRVLKESDNPLVVRNELLTNNRTGIRCVLRKAEEAGCPAKVVVRVFGDRNWTEEGYKTFMVEPSTKISEVVTAALRLFRDGASESPSAFALCPLANNASGAAIPADATLGPNLGSAQFALRRASAVGVSPYQAPLSKTSAPNLRELAGPESADAAPPNAKDIRLAARRASIASSEQSLNSNDNDNDDDDLDDDEDESTMDVTPLSPVAASEKLRHDAEQAGDAKAQLLLNVMTIPDASSDAPTGIGGPINARMASIAAQFGDGYTSLSRKSLPKVHGQDIAALLKQFHVDS